jgi:hypothetical protein
MRNFLLIDYTFTNTVANKTCHCDDCMDAGGRVTHGAVTEERSDAAIS